MRGARRTLEALFPDVAPATGLAPRGAAAMAALAASPVYDAASLVECRVDPRDARGTIVIVDVEVPLGQREPVNDVHPVETVAFHYVDAGTPPGAYPLREDFPEHLPHINTSWVGEPRSLCLFEMPPEEILRIATPHVMLERVRWWLAESAHGRLHGDQQPLDPFFAIVGRPLVLPRGGLAGLGRAPLTAVTHDDAKEAPVFLLDGMAVAGPDSRPYAAVVASTAPIGHAGVRRLPRSLEDLVGIYRDAGVDVATPLRDAFRRWTDVPDLVDVLRRPLLMVLQTPIERRPGEVDGVDFKGFHCGRHNAGEVAEALNALLVAGDKASVPIPDVGPNAAMMRGIPTFPLDVYASLDRRLVRAAAGRGDNAGDDRAVTLIGAGALGSQLALSAARMGIGTWTVVDPDHLMPHNLARHALTAGHAGMAKAKALAGEVEGILGPGSARAVVAAAEDISVAMSIQGSDLVVDASASVPTARWLALRSGHAARTASIFLNPRGDDLVILREGADRRPRIDQVEMAFHWLIASDERLEGHFSPAAEGLHPSGGCRSPSLLIAQTRVGMLANLAAERVFAPASEKGLIEVCRATADGVRVVAAEPPDFREIRIGDFDVSASAAALSAMTAARAAAGDRETGGILVGSWDRQREAFYLVAALDPPPDSVSSRTGFVRGQDGVYATLDEVERRTAGNLTYVGEWHTHPQGHGTAPSGDDRILLEWIADVLAFSDVPACMAIVGEEGVRLILGTYDHHAVLSFAS